MAENDTILFSKCNGVATMILNRPNNMNAMSPALVDELQTALNLVRSDADIRCLIITGNGRAFCAGGDVTSFPGANPVEGRRYMREAHRTLLAMVGLEKPIIAAVNGHAVGGGFNLALACDLIVASENAVFGQVFSKVGLIPDFGGLFFLPRIVGLPRAKELMFSGRNITAKEAKDYGIVMEVTAPDQLMLRVEQLATSFAHGPSISMGITKEILNRSFEMSLEQILHEEAMAQGIAFTTLDHKEGVRAFLEKRKPDFQGR